MGVGRNLGVGLHPREDDQPPCLEEGASDLDGGGEEDLAYLANKEKIYSLNTITGAKVDVFK